MIRKKSILPEDIPVSEQHLRLRKVLFVMAILIALGAFGWALYGLFRVDSGWAVVEADGGSGLSCAGDFTLQYELGVSGTGALQERRAVTAVYTVAALRGWQLFYPSAETEGEVNLRWLNEHPNAEAEVDPALYSALSQTLSAGRWLYLGPLYEQAESLLASRTAAESVDFDPLAGGEAAAFTREALSFLGDPDHITLYLLGDNRVCLRVSEAYLRFAEDWGVSRYIDFSWQREAYIADMMADALLRAGLPRFILSAHTGFTRCGAQGGFLQQLYTLSGGRAVLSGSAPYTGPAAIVSLRAFPLTASERWYAAFDGGQARTAFLSLSDGLAHTAAEALWLSRGGGTCAGLMNSALPLWLTDDVDMAGLKALAGEGVCVLLDREGAFEEILPE